MKVIYKLDLAMRFGKKIAFTGVQQKIPKQFISISSQLEKGNENSKIKIDDRIYKVAPEFNMMFFTKFPKLKIKGHNHLKIFNFSLSSQSLKKEIQKIIINTLQPELEKKMVKL